VWGGGLLNAVHYISNYVSFCGGVTDILVCRYGPQVVTRCGQKQMSENVFVIDGQSV